jgi:hypothetical protein
MALQGNPFLGKLKIPAPDLSRIPETAFEGRIAKPEVPSSTAALNRPDNTPKPGVEKSERAATASRKRQKPESPTTVAAAPVPHPAEIVPESNRFQTASIGFGNRFQTASDIGFIRLQQEGEATDRNLLKPNETEPNRFQTVSETVSAIGFKLPPIGELAVLRHLADRESPIGAPIPVRRREVAVATAQTLAGVKTALIRLSKVRLLELVEFKCGKINGFTSYRLTAQARTVLASKEAGDSIGFKRFQTVSETVSIGFSSSSSSLIEKNLKTTTTSEPELFDDGRFQLAPEWKVVDIACVSTIGFTRHQLAQLIRDGHLTPDEVKDSLAYFAFAYERGDLKKIRDPLGYLMSILRKPSTFPRPEGYETPLEASRRKNREAIEQAEFNRHREEEKFQEIGYSRWRRGVDREVVNTIVPEVVRHVPRACEAALREHYDQAVWPVERVSLFEAKPEDGALDPAAVGRLIDHALGEATK